MACTQCKLAGLGAKRKKSGIGNKGSDITATLTAVALSAGGAIAAQELGAMVPEDTVPAEYVDMAKLVLPVLVPLVGINEPMVDKFMEGMAVQGALALYERYVKKSTPAATTAAAGSRLSGAFRAGTPVLNGYYSEVSSPVLNGVKETVQTA